MAYSIHDDLVKWIDVDQLLELASQSSEASIQDDGVTVVLDEVIASADALIDSYCLNRWSDLRTEDPVPDLINQMSARIAIYYMYERRGDAPDARRLAYEDCLKQLKLFADGKISLGLDTDGNVAGAAEGAFDTDASTDYEPEDDDPRVFTKDKLDKF